MRDCLLSAAISQPIAVMCMLMIAAGVACLYAHADAELRHWRAAGVRWSALAWLCWICCLHNSGASVMSWEACHPVTSACCLTCSRLLCIAWRCISNMASAASICATDTHAEGPRFTADSLWTCTAPELCRQGHRSPLVQGASWADQCTGGSLQVFAQCLCSATPATALCLPVCLRCTT